jgi:hypothetical protein
LLAVVVDEIVVVVPKASGRSDLGGIGRVVLRLRISLSKRLGTRKLLEESKS